jgi:hypothetical protein
MIVPVAGLRPGTEKALRSLLEQDYPRYSVVFATAEDDDPAVPLINALVGEYARARHVTAGRAVRCGQKNFNSLAGVSALGDAAEIYVFCDSTHTAGPDFLRVLVRPLAAGEAAFSTGYHAVEAEDALPVTLAYQMTVIIMRLLQSCSLFTQPWGGAMAVSRAAFERYGVERLWAGNVVDDCSLAARLTAVRGRVRLCPEALLRTPAARHSLAQWRNWFERQILFLKFCTPALWRLMGPGICLLLLPTLFSLALLPLCIADPRPAHLPAVLHLCLLGLFALNLREFADNPPPGRAWLAAFALNLWMLGRVYVGSIAARTLRWHDTLYHVGKGGRVRRLETVPSPHSDSSGKF